MAANALGLPLEQIASFAAFALVMSITPGPNNVIALSSGVNFGFRRSMPFFTGVSLGFPVMLAILATGFRAVLLTAPWAFDAIRIAGVLYLLWMAWHIATAGDIDGGGNGTRPAPLTVVQSALLQWVNPKAWTIAVGALAAYTTADAYWASIAIMSVLFAVIAWPSTAVWALFGQLVRRWLSTPARLRAFNVTMALLLVLSLAPIVLQLMRGAL